MVNKGATVENGLGKPENLIKLINHDEPPGIKHGLPDNPSFFFDDFFSYGPPWLVQRFPSQPRFISEGY